MKYRHLGRSGIQISEIGLGGWLTFGQSVEEKQGRALIDKAMECGINFYDTANVYARGKCEEMWGDLLKNYRRSSFVLATKVFGKMGDWPTDEGLSRKHIMEQCHASLRRLQTDYIDVYQCHRYDESTPLEETVRAMNTLVEQGKILYWGFSEWSKENIEDVMEICGDRYYRPVSSQPQYNLLQRYIEPEIIPLCEKEGVGQVVFCPLAQGLLTGKYKPGQPIPEDSRAANPDTGRFIADKAKDEDLLKKIQQLEPIAKDLGCTMPQLALAWILRKQNVSSCIIGATKTSQIEENARAVDIELKDDQLKRMDELFGEK